LLTVSERDTSVGLAQRSRKSFRRQVTAQSTAPVFDVRRFFGRRSIFGRRSTWPIRFGNTNRHCAIGGSVRTWVRRYREPVSGFTTTTTKTIAATTQATINTVITMPIRRIMRRRALPVLLSSRRRFTPAPGIFAGNCIIARKDASFIRPLSISNDRSPASARGQCRRVQPAPRSL